MKILASVCTSICSFGFALVLSACAMMNAGGNEGPVVRKEVKDVPAKVRKEDASPRKRLMILPFLDASDLRAQSLRDHARTEVLKELNRTGELIAIDSNDLKVDFSKSMKSGEYQMEEMAKLSQSLGVAALLEGKILDIKVHKKSDEVGVFRQMKSTFDCVVRVRIMSSRSAKELFNTTKSLFRLKCM